MHYSKRHLVVNHSQNIFTSNMFIPSFLLLSEAVLFCECHFVAAFMSWIGHRNFCPVKTLWCVLFYLIHWIWHWATSGFSPKLKSPLVVNVFNWFKTSRKPLQHNSRHSVSIIYNCNKFFKFRHSWCFQPHLAYHGELLHKTKCWAQFSTGKGSCDVQTPSSQPEKEKDSSCIAGVPGVEEEEVCRVSTWGVSSSLSCKLRYCCPPPFLNENKSRCVMVWGALQQRTQNTLGWTKVNLSSHRFLCHLQGSLCIAASLPHWA